VDEDEAALQLETRQSIEKHKNSSGLILSSLFFASDKTAAAMLWEQQQMHTYE